MRALDPADRRAVLVLVCLLRLARALDQSRKSTVQKVTAGVHLREVVLKLAIKPSGGGDLEALGGRERAEAYFQFVFGRVLTVR